MNSSADWGPSDPFTLQESIVEFRRRGHSLQDAVEIYHNNPCRFLGQNQKGYKVNHHFRRIDQLC